MTEMQKKLLSMLQWLDRFCSENGLTYYAIGGTLLGAVRHQGFIPWDDDIDIGMPRKDYERFEELMEGKIEDRYRLETYRSIDPSYCYPYDKLYDVSTTLVENYRKPLKRGIFIDVFPLDGAGESQSDSEKWCRSVNRAYHFYLTRMAATNKGRAKYKNAAILLSRIIPDSILNNTKMRIRLNQKCKKYEFGQSKYAGNMLGNWGIKEIVPTEVIGQPQRYLFENIEISGIEKYDEYLATIYGNWRQLPPEEKRVSQHDYLYLRLNKSYLNDEVSLQTGK